VTLAYKKERSAVSICCYSPLHRLSERRDNGHNPDMFSGTSYTRDDEEQEIMTVYVTVAENTTDSDYRS